MKLRIFLWTLFLTTIGQNAFSQTWPNQQKIIAFDRIDDVLFGWSVGISGSNAIVGVPYESRDQNSQNLVGTSGAAYTYRRLPNGTWRHDLKLVASDRSRGARFGESVDIYNNIAVIGAPEDPFNEQGEDSVFKAGKVYVFERDETGAWHEKQIICSPHRGFQALFGGSVAIWGDLMVIGSQLDRLDENGENPMSSAGAAYVYRRGKDGKWVFHTKLLPFVRGFPERFGNDVDIHENRIIIGAYRDGTSINNSEMGAAYVFDLNLDDEWEKTQKLTASTRIPDDQFGWSVAVNGDRCVIGAPKHWAEPSFIYDESGAVYVFDWNSSSKSWKQTSLLLQNDYKQYDELGNSVSMSDSMIALGSVGDNNKQGAIYVSVLKDDGQWSGFSTIRSPDGSPGDFFAIEISTWNRSLISGARGEDHDLDGKDSLAGAGSAYIFEPGSVLSSLELIDINDEIAVYPNPSSGKVYIRSGILEGSVTVMNLNGQVLDKHEFVPGINHIFISSTPGVYFLKFESLNHTLTYKVLVH